MGAELVRRFDRRSGHTLLADAELWVTPEVWSEVCDLVEQAARLIHAQAQPPRTEGTRHVNLTAAVFELQGDTDGERS